MRPTNLGFRSPKELTSGLYFPQVSYDGRSLYFSEKRDRRNLPRAIRFPRGNTGPSHLNPNLGPGSYFEKELERNSNSPGGTVYRPLHFRKEDSIEGCTMIGNNIVRYDHSNATDRSFAHKFRGKSLEEPHRGSCTPNVNSGGREFPRTKFRITQKIRTDFRSVYHSPVPFAYKERRPN